MKDANTQKRLKCQDSLLTALRYTGSTDRPYFKCRCPVAGHGRGRGDLSPSLTVTPTNDRMLVHCNVGCSTEDVLEAIGFSFSNLFYDSGDSSRTMDDDTIYAIADLDHWWLKKTWPNKTDRDIVRALLNVAWKHGRLDDAGVRFSLSRRDLALKAAVSLSTVQASVKRLRQDRIIGTPNTDRLAAHAGEFVLLTRATTNTHDRCSESFTRAHARLADHDGCVPILARIRHAGVFGHERCIGKSTGEFLERLLFAGGKASVRDIGNCMGLARPRDARKHAAKLRELGVIALDGDRVALRDCWREALDHHRDVSGQLTRDRLDRAQYERERTARWDPKMPNSHFHKSEAASAKPTTPDQEIHRWNCLCEDCTDSVVMPWERHAKCFSTASVQGIPRAA